MLKTVLIAAVAIVAFNAVFVFSGGLERLVQTEQAGEQQSNRVEQDIVEVFRFALEDEVIKKQGQPTEGFTPDLFLNAFSGLAATDFAGVKTVTGQYVVVDGQLQHELIETDAPTNSERTAIHRTGYVVLLDNVANRAGINLAADGTITDIMTAITSQ